MKIKTSLILLACLTINATAINTFSKDDYKLDSREWQSVKLAKKWLNHNTKLMKGKDGKIIFLFGQTMPTVICSPFKTADIELDPGEVIKDIKSGDSVRWLFFFSLSGSGKAEISHVLVKPVDLGITTNLTIFTNRRAYHLNLASKKNSWTPYVSFAYSESLQKTLNAYNRYQKEKKQNYKKFNDFHTASNRTIDISRLNFKYSLSGNADWKPVRVYDDGVKTYIELPTTVFSGELPALLVINHGRKELVNYRYKKNTFILT